MGNPKKRKPAKSGAGPGTKRTPKKAAKAIHAKRVGAKKAAAKRAPPKRTPPKKPAAKRAPPKRPAGIVTGPVGPADLAAGYARLVSSVCWRMTRDRDHARFAARAVWEEAVPGLPSLRRGTDLRIWLFAIVRRATAPYAGLERRYTLRYLRDFFSDGDFPVPDRPGFDKAQWVRSMCDRCLSGALQCLEPDERLAFLLEEVVGLTPAEIAKVFGRTEPPVRKILTRSRLKMTTLLTRQCALANPATPSLCRMRVHVLEVDLPAAFARARRSSKNVLLYAECERVLPPKDYWSDPAPE